MSQPVIAADSVLGKLAYRMSLYRRVHHSRHISVKRVERSKLFHFYETDFIARRRITTTIATATMTAAGMLPMRAWSGRGIVEGNDESSAPSKVCLRAFSGSFENYLITVSTMTMC
jgi:hypothetical protein